MSSPSTTASRLLPAFILLAAFAGALHASSALPYPGPIRSSDEVSNDVPNILDEHPLTARPPDNRILPKLIYFPPNPPPLGVPVHLPEGRDIVTAGPDAMAPFVNEAFYAPLSSFISPVVTAYQGGDTMSDADKSRLNQYAKERAALLAELRATIQDLVRADPGRRLRDFIALSERQTPRLVELEKTAETMRARFARLGNWDELREWRLSGQRPPGLNIPGATLEMQVLRAAAFYFDGLSPAQRRLLREIAMEIESTIFLPKDSRPTAQLFLFFQPETSRIPRPTKLPDNAQRLLRRFIDTKERLKEELRDAVWEADASRSHRGLATLADAHAPRIEALEETAEDLRAALARVPGFPRTPAPTPVPRAIAERIEKFLVARREIVARTGRADDEALAPLQTEMDALRGILALQPGIVLNEGQAPDAFLTNFLRTQREASAYYEYDIAVLEPGLSPEQRRLLFGGALELLQLPLPGAEEQPTLPPGTMLR